MAKRRNVKQPFKRLWIQKRTLSIHCKTGKLSSPSVAFSAQVYSYLLRTGQNQALWTWLCHSPGFLCVMVTGWRPLKCIFSLHQQSCLFKCTLLLHLGYLWWLEKVALVVCSNAAVGSFRWALWFFKNDKSKTWQANLRLISKFDTVEDFWA